MSNNYFDQYVKYRLLDFKFTTIGHESNGLCTLLENELEKNIHLKQVCAKLPVQLVDRLEGTISKLDISKRRFIEIALIEAIEKVEQLESEIDLYEFVTKED